MSDSSKPVSPEVRVLMRDWLALGIGNDVETYEQRRAIWQELDALCWRNGEWTRSVHDAEIATDYGFSLAWMKDDLPRMRDLYVRFLSHPNLGSEGFADDLWEWRLWINVLEHFIGNERETANRLLGPIRDGSHTTGYRNTLRRVINNVLDSLHHEEIHPATRELVVELLAVTPGYKRASKKAETAATHVELSDLLRG